MSITRKLLKGMGLTEEQQDSIFEAYSETLTEIKAERDKYKADAEKLPDVQKQLDELKAAGDGGYKEKYDKEHKAFEDYKAEQTAKESKAGKEKAFRTLLSEIGISEKRIDKVMKVSDIDGIEIDEKGAIKDAAKLKKALTDEWSDFIVKTEVKGADTPTPPASNAKKSMTKDEIIAIKDAGERTKAIAENAELFGIK